MGMPSMTSKAVMSVYVNPSGGQDSQCWDDITTLLSNFILPIYSFCRTVNGSTYHGVAKEKARAAQEFQDRLQAGENVGLVESRYMLLKTSYP